MGKFLPCQLGPLVRADMETTIVTPAEDEMVGWRHRLNGQTPGNGEGQRSLLLHYSGSQRVGHDVVTEQQRGHAENVEVESARPQILPAESWALECTLLCSFKTPGTSVRVAHILRRMSWEESEC